MRSSRFVSGVASGDPSTTSVVLWGRVDGPGPVEWSIADIDADAVAASGTVRPDDRGVVSVEIEGLRPGREFRYGFTDGDDHSPEGCTRTLAAAAVTLRLGVACCARLPSGPFTGYRALADADLDLVVHLGDYIYEDGGGGVRGAHDPPHECVTSDDYDRRYAQYRSDPDLQALHAAAPWVSTLDDHEIEGNAVRFASSQHPHRTQNVVDPERRRAGVGAHTRWMPQRSHGNGPSQRDRHLAVGDLCDLVMVDTRLGGREQQVRSDGPATKPPVSQSPQLLSDEQWEWLEHIVDGSTASWLLLATQVQVAPLRLGWLPARNRHRRWPVRIAPLINPDQWDGYPSERQRLLDLLDRHDRDDVVILSGDLHGRFATTIRRAGRPSIAEVTTPSISAPTFASTLDTRLPIPSSWTARWIKAINPHIEHLDLAHHGATVADISHDVIRFHDAVRPDAWSWSLRRR